MRKMSLGAVVSAAAVGLVCSLMIWVSQPLNNYLLNNSFIADNYLPELGVALVALLVLGLNPLLRRLAPSRVFSVRQLALIFAMILVAAVPTQVLRVLPHSLARMNRDIAVKKNLADIHAEMNLPDALYLEPVGFGEETPASSQLVDELEPGNTIPWRVWLKPVLAWGSMVAFSWILMLGLALILFPQWRENERLPFPLLTVQQELIEAPAPGRLLPPIFCSKAFWVGLGAVVLVHAFNGLNHHTGGAVPPFPRNWSLWGAFSDGLWRHMTSRAKTGQILFTIVGVTYFVPKRVSFSLWVTFIAYEVYRMIGYEYFAPFHYGTVADHRNGATLGVALVILWLGRNQWVAVAKAMVRPAKDDVDRRNRTAGGFFLVGSLGVLGWHLWAGNTLGWALLSLAMLFITSLVLSRIVAETGIPFLSNYLGAGHLMAMMPMKWFSPASLYLVNMADVVMREGSSRVSAAVAGIHALGVDRDQPPRGQARLVKGLLVVLAVGFIICGTVHLWMGYNYPGSLDGGRVPIARWGSTYVNSRVHNPLRAYARKSWEGKPYNQIGHFAFGVAAGIGLQIACLLSPLWPLHPVGLLLAGGWFIGKMWPSIFLGWAVKSLIITYGGAQSFRKLRPLFLGLILGEVFSAVLWALVPVVLIALGGAPAEVGHIVIVPQ